MKMPTGMSLDDLRAIGEAIYKRNCYDGYSGTITGFSDPRTNAGDTLKIIDPLELDHQGNYLIEAVHKTYDLSSGFDRENTLSFKV
jgi:hypothetical protein